MMQPLKPEEDPLVTAGFLSALLDTTENLVTVVDHSGRVVVFNRACEKLTGYSLAELQARAAEELLLVPEEREELMRLFEELLRGGGGQTHRNHWRTRDGGRRLISWSNTVLRDSAGDARYVVSTGVDITASSTAEAAASRGENSYRAVVEQASDAIMERESQEQVRLLLDSTAEGIYRLDMGGRCTFANRATAHLLGYDDRAELRGKNMHLLAHHTRADGAPYPQEECPIYGVLRKGVPIHVDDERFWRADGSTFPVEYWSYPIRSEGQVVGAVVTFLDIGERKQAEKLLQESEQRYRTVLEHAPAGMALLDLDGLHLQVNRALCAMLGYSEEELLGLDFPQLTHPDDLEADLSQTRRLLAGEIDSFQMEKRYNHKDGHIVWGLLSAAVVRDAAGQPLYLVSQAHDITQRKEAEEALRRSEAWSRAFLEAIPDMLFRFSRDGVFVGFHPAPDAELLVAPEVFLGRHVSEVLPSDVAASLLHYLEEAMSTRRRQSFEYRLPMAGEWRYFEAHCAANGPDEALAIVHEITNRKRAEEELRASEQRFRALFENSLDAMYIFDERGRVVDANRVAFGRSSGGVDPRGHSLADLIPQQQRGVVQESWQRLLTEGELRGEFTRDDPDGPRVFEFSAKANFLPGYHLAVSRDVTEQRRVDEANRAREAAEAANRAKSAYLSRMSHELRTPLNAILGFAQLLEMDHSEANLQESIMQINKAGWHLLELINEVLDIARVESGRLSLAREPVDLDGVVQLTLDLVQQIVAARKLTVTSELSVPGDYRVLADEQRLKQVVLNVISNAVKYNRDRGMIRIGYRRTSPGRVRLLITDTGPGIPADKLDQVFMPFERLGSEYTPVEGTGLGLTISKELVEAMGGRIGAESQVGVGSTFWIELPEAERTEDTGRAAPSGDELLHAMQQAAPLAARKRILYIEDNPTSLALVDGVLKQRPDLELLSAHTGLGYELARDRQIDLVLLDLHLPDLSGEEVLRRLRSDPATRSIPVVVLSADAQPSVIKRLLDAGARDYLTKPLDVRTFLDTLARLLP